MEQKLSQERKEKIRDEIDRLKHLKEPWLKAVEIMIPAFITLLVIILGTSTNYLDNMVETNGYNITLQNNQSENISGLSYGKLEPIEQFNSKNMKLGFQQLFLAMMVIYLVITFLTIFASKYAKYDEQIKMLYNELLGIKNQKPDKISKIRTFFFNLKTKIFKILNSNREMVNKNTLEDFFEKNKYVLIVLSIFLLVTIELVGKNGYLNNLLALTSSLITYFVLIGIDAKRRYDKDTFPLWGFNIIFPIFISTFCAWVMLNIVITLTGELAKVI